jgi:hypothetical protein
MAIASSRFPARTFAAAVFLHYFERKRSAATVAVIVSEPGITDTPRLLLDYSRVPRFNPATAVKIID